MEAEEAAEETVYSRFGSRVSDPNAPQIAALSAWLKSQRSLPHDIDDDVLSTFLDWTDSKNVEEYITSFFRARQKFKKIFRHRQPGLRQFERYSSVMVAPFTTPETLDWVVFGTWLSDDDETKFSAYHQAKLIFTELDLLLQEGCLGGKTIQIVMDMSLYTKKHVSSITRYAAHTISRLLVSAVPAQIGGVFLINAPDWISDYTELYPPFDFHILDDTTQLKGFVLRDLLPSDLYGYSDAPTRQELADEFTARLWRHAGWLADEELRREKELYIYSTEPDVVETPAGGEKSKKKKKTRNK